MTFHRSLTRCLLLAGLALCSLLTPASAKEIACPATISVQEAADVTALSGWRAYNSGSNGVRHFYGVGFSEGPPENLVFRTPVKTVATKQEKSETFDFSSGLTGEIWISCFYRDTAMSVTMKMAEKFSRCEVAYDRKTAFRTVKQVDCF
jgi:hypothetical protein